MLVLMIIGGAPCPTGANITGNPGRSSRVVWRARAYITYVCDRMSSGPGTGWKPGIRLLRIKDRKGIVYHATQDSREKLPVQGRGSLDWMCSTTWSHPTSHLEHPISSLEKTDIKRFQEVAHFSNRGNRYMSMVTGKKPSAAVFQQLTKWLPKRYVGHVITPIL